MKTESSTTNIGFGGFLLLLFVTLKLCHVIDWSWWWVLSPVWIPVALLLAVFLFVLIFSR